MTATNLATNKKYATTTDVTGAFAMAVPANGPYAVKAELAAFHGGTKDVSINGQGAEAVRQSRWWTSGCNWRRGWCSNRSRSDRTATGPRDSSEGSDRIQLLPGRARGRRDAEHRR